MIKVSNLTKSYETGIVLQKVNLVVSGGEKVGLVGTNGCGKSTLLKIIARVEQADEGSVLVDKNDVVGYLPQHLSLDSTTTVREFLLEPYSSLINMEQEMRRLEESMVNISGKELEKTLSAYGDIQVKFEAAGGYEFETRLETVLSGLGLKLEMSRQMSTLSGGQRARVAMAQVLLKSPTILLLDEPTNHLDLPSLIWLEEYLREGSKTVVLVSHDRRFLDRTVTRIIEIDKASHSTVEFGGNYSAYLEEKKRLHEKLLQGYQSQQKKLNALSEDIKKTKAQAQRTEAATHDSKFRRYAKKVAKKAKARERRLERQLGSEDTIKKPEEKKPIKVSFKGSDSRELLIRLESVAKAYETAVPIRNLSLEVHGGEKVALIGGNGSGKTTLLRLILGREQPDTGLVYKSEVTDIGYQPQDQSELIKSGKRVIDWFRREVAMPEDEARAYLGSFYFSQDALFGSISKLSNGEISRLVISALVAEEHNLLLLDEPTNHLDLESVEVIETALKEYSGAMIVVTHDRYLLRSIPFDRILSLEDGRVKEYSSWDSYETKTLSAQRR